MRPSDAITPRVILPVDRAAAARKSYVANLLGGHSPANGRDQVRDRGQITRLKLVNRQVDGRGKLVNQNDVSDWPD
ncbi:hypothetical protein [Acidisoma sp. S159]|uniref:hypothetical protein n=1 Tax=Acidisoma sp. S159 TaxID=1747225 RepID=UPI00131C098D|nr:hypothetical protein [Acidisoma sp. S159]